MAGVYALVGTKSPTDRWDAGRVLEAVLGAIAVALVGLIAVRFWGPAPALLSAAIAAIYPPLVRLGTSLMSESLFIPLMLGAVLTALVYRDAPRPRRWAILTGVLVGCAALTRANGVLLVLPIWFLVWHERPRISWRSVLGPAVVLLVTIGLLRHARNGRAAPLFLAFASGTAMNLAWTVGTPASSFTGQTVKSADNNANPNCSGAAFTTRTSRKRCGAMVAYTP